MPDKKKILLIGFDSNLCLGIVYCLKKYGYSFYVLSWNKNISTKYSFFVKKTFIYENYDHLETTVIDIVQKHKIDVIMPFDENEIRWVKENNALLSKYAACTWGTQPDLFELGINKRRLAEFLTEHDIPCPRFATVYNKEQLKEESEKIGYPLLIKPTRSNFGRGIQKFENWEGLKAFYTEDKDPEKEYIIQPFLIGSDVTCNVICREGEILCHTIQESPIKTGSNFSSNDILEFHEDAGVIAAVAPMLKLLKWHGVACIDMRRDQRDGQVKILEINGRFWASMVSSYLKAGVNFPLMQVKLALGQEVEFPKMRPAFQIAFKQYLKNLRTFKKTSFRDTKYISYISDPIARALQMMGL